jgi:prevent-host-death family protein
MKTYPFSEARAEFSKLVDRALAGEPARVTRHGSEAVLIVSEEAWSTRQAAVTEPRTASSLGALLARHARAGTFRHEVQSPDTEKTDVADRPWTDRPLGADTE